MFGRKTPFYCYNMYLTAAVLVSLSLVYMVMVSLLYGYGGGSCVFSPAFYCFGFYFLPPFAFFLLFSFLFRWLSDMDSVLGIRVGGVLLFFTMSCNDPITPKRFYFFFITTPFTSYLWTLIPTFLLPCSPILYILFAAKAAPLPVCLFCDHKRCSNVSFPTSGLGGFLVSIRFSILCSLLYPVPRGTGFSDSHLIPWSMVKDCFNASLSSFSWFWFWGVAIINMSVYFILDSPSIVWIIGLCTTGGFLIFIVPQFQY